MENLYSLEGISAIVAGYTNTIPVIDNVVRILRETVHEVSTIVAYDSLGAPYMFYFYGVNSIFVF